MAHLLIVDDEQSICWGLSQLADQLGHTARCAASVEQAMAEQAAPPDLVLLDIRLPGADGLSSIPRIKESFGAAPIVLMTAYGQLDTAVKAVRSGAYEYLVKPFSLEVVERTIQRALESRRHLLPEPDIGNSIEASPGETLVGQSAAMRKAFKQIALAASSDACVHIRGESGTGKELVARAVHRHSTRGGGPFVPIHAAALSPTLAESELFGHVRGAFTGAEQARRGLLQEADGGAVFLDEVAEIPLALQIKLLRALEHGEVWPVGANHPVKTDFRLISATHQDLRQCVSSGTFRHDLYFRLVTFQIELPSLRERCEDLAELAEHFVGMLARRTSAASPRISPELLVELQRRPWYGNVRELRNALEHAMIVARGGMLLPEHLPQVAPSAAPASDDGEDLGDQIAALVRRWADQQLADSNNDKLHAVLLALVESPLLQAALDKHHGQCTNAARRLGLHRVTLRKKLDELGLNGD
jgi:two-component system nitrogen regulation response regulator GlnG